MGVQVIKCKCGKPFAGCLEPYCYTDKDWQKDLRDYVNKGYTVEVVEQGTLLESCVCEKEQDLFNQQS